MSSSSLTLARSAESSLESLESDIYETLYLIIGQRKVLLPSVQRNHVQTIAYGFVTQFQLVDQLVNFLLMVHRFEMTAKGVGL